MSPALPGSLAGSAIPTRVRSLRSVLCETAHVVGKVAHVVAELFHLCPLGVIADTSHRIGKRLATHNDSSVIAELVYLYGQYKVLLKTYSMQCIPATFQ
jgi:hypothetical protein